MHCSGSTISKSSAGRDRSDKRTEKRDDIGDPYDAADQQSVLPSENRHAHEAQQADDQRVYDLAIDKSAKGLIRKGSSIQDLLRRMFTKKCHDHFFTLCRKQILAVQEISTDDDRNKKVFQYIQYSDQSC